MINRVELLGNLTHNPELRYTAQGTPYCLIRLATHRYSGGLQRTDFHFVTAWYGHAERAAQQLKTGDSTFVEGRLETAAFVDGDGKRQERARIVATRVLSLNGHRRSPTVTEPTGMEHIAEIVGDAAPASEVREPAGEEA
jgi:single-strand DNA-binding protein